MVPVVAACIGSFLAGDWSDEVVLPACAAVLELARRDTPSANVAADLLLAAYGNSAERRLSEVAKAAVLRTAVRVRAGEDDPTAVDLAQRAYTDRPLNWLTVDTMQAAVKVASAHGCYRLADDLCNQTAAILSEQFQIQPGRELEGERTEYALFLHHQRSGTARRRLDDGGGPEDLRRAFLEHDAAQRECELAFERAAAGAPGDVDERWRFYLAVRGAELRLITLRRQYVGNVEQRLRIVDALIDQAGRIATRKSFAELEFVPLIKVQLNKALTEDDTEVAIDGLRRLHALGWPLTRTLPDILSISQPTTLRKRAPKVLREAVDEVAAAERDPSWRAAGAETAAGWRKARARTLGR
jgi:hypothetical protein